MHKHPAFLPPPCCGQVRIQELLNAIYDGGGTVYLKSGLICPRCQTGQGIVLDFVRASFAEQQHLECLLAFGEITGFKPTIIVNAEQRAEHVARYLKETSEGRFWAGLQTVLRI